MSADPSKPARRRTQRRCHPTRRRRLWARHPGPGTAGRRRPATPCAPPPSRSRNRRSPAPQQRPSCSPCGWPSWPWAPRPRPRRESALQPRPSWSPCASPSSRSSRQGHRQRRGHPQRRRHPQQQSHRPRRGPVGPQADWPPDAACASARLPCRPPVRPWMSQGWSGRPWVVLLRGGRGHCPTSRRCLGGARPSKPGRCGAVGAPIAPLSCLAGNAPSPAALA